MSVLLNYFWPCFVAALVVGGISGTVALRRPSRRLTALGIGIVAAVGLTLLWHGPMAGADRLASEIERDVHGALVHYEMTQVTGHLHRNPLTRRLVLSGPADDFQRSELVRLLNQIPGVSGTGWSPDRPGVPLVLQGLAAAVLGFLLGLLLAYLIELRRRYNAQWTW